MTRPIRSPRPLRPRPRQHPESKRLFPMAGYLDSYGVADQRRERIVKFSLMIGLSTILIVTVGYFSFRTHSQERVVSQFLGDLEHQQYRKPISCGAVRRIANITRPTSFWRTGVRRANTPSPQPSRSSTSISAMKAWSSISPIPTPTTSGCG